MVVLGRPKFRRSRTIFSPEQLDILEEHFGKYKYPDVKRRRAIAEEVGLPEERVQVWFQNRRAKNKRQADQQVKLQKLVNEAISSNASNEQQHLQNIQGSSDLGETYCYYNCGSEQATALKFIQINFAQVLRQLFYMQKGTIYDFF